MALILRFFGILIVGGVCIIGLILVNGFFSSVDQDRSITSEQDFLKKQKAAAVSQARLKADLKSELETNRDGVIRQINALINSQYYLLAHQKADRFREFGDNEINLLASTALNRHEEAERFKTLQKEQRIASALKKMTKRTDEIEGIDWYKDKSSPRYVSQNGFFLYIGKKSTGLPWLRLGIQYADEDWLFIESFIVVADDQRFERREVEFERDSDGNIWEWYDESVTEADLKMIKAVVESKDAVIRFNGQKYRDDKKITPSQKAALKNVLEAYEAFGGRA